MEYLWRSILPAFSLYPNEMNIFNIYDNSVDGKVNDYARMPCTWRISHNGLDLLGDFCRVLG